MLNGKQFQKPMHLIVASKMMWRVLEIFKLKTGEKRPIRNKEMCNTTRQNDSIERRQLKSSFAMKKILKKMCVSCD